MGSSVRRVLTICLNGSAPLNKVTVMPIYGKTIKNLLLQNQDSFETVSLYIAFGTQGLPVCSNDGLRLIFYRFTQGQICTPIHLSGENVQNSFSKYALKANG